MTIAMMMIIAILKTAIIKIISNFFLETSSNETFFWGFNEHLNNKMSTSSRISIEKLSIPVNRRRNVLHGTTERTSGHPVQPRRASTPYGGTYPPKSKGGGGQHFCLVGPTQRYGR